MNPHVMDSDMKAATFRFREKPYNVVCVEKKQDLGDLEAAEALLENTFKNMKGLYELVCKGSPSALDSSTWLLMGALNLAHRVVRLEREAATQTRDLEERLSKLLEDVPNDAAPTEPETTL